MRRSLDRETFCAGRAAALPRVVILAAVLVAGSWGTRATVLAQGLTDAMNEAQKALNDAELLAQQNRVAEARALYLQAIRLNPRFVKAFEQYSLFLSAHGRFKEGAKAMSIGLKLNPGTPELRAQLGMHLFRLGRVLEAYNLLRSSAATEALRDRYEVQVIFAQAAIMMEDYPAAVAAIDRYLAFRPSSLSRRDAAFRVQLAIALMRQGAVARAGKELSRAISETPKSVRARLAMAELQLRSGKCSQALAAFEQLQPVAKTRELPILIGESYLCMRRYREALATARSFIAQMDGPLRELIAKPSLRQRYYVTLGVLRQGLMLRGSAAEQVGAHAEALEAYQQVEKLAGATERTELCVARTLFHLQRFEEAAEKLQRQLATAQPEPAAVELAIRAAVRTKHLKEAVTHAERLAKLGTTAQQLYFAGVGFSSAGRFERARDLYRRALAVDRRHDGARRELVRALSYLARRALRKQDVARAAQAMAEAHRLEPTSPAVNQNLALLELRQGNVARALEHANAAARAKPHDGLVNQLAGRALAAQGKHKDAIVHFLRASERAGGLDGKALARVQVELAASRLTLGQVEQGITELEQALKLATKAGDGALLALVLRDLLRARLARALDLVDRGQAALALRELEQTQKAVSSLPEKERWLVHLATLLARAHNGEVEAAREEVRRHGEQLTQLLQPSYAELGSDFLLAYIDYHGRPGQGRQAVGPRLERLMARASSPARERLRDLTVSANAQVALKAFAGGKPREAAQPLAKIKRLARAISPELRHNLAVVEYYAGVRDEPLHTLQASSAKVPMGLCNLAVHFDGKGGSPAKAYELFSQCDQRGVKFPNLKVILTIKRQIFGRLKGGGA